MSSLVENRFIPSGANRKCFIKAALELGCGQVFRISPLTAYRQSILIRNRDSHRYLLPKVLALLCQTNVNNMSLKMSKKQFIFYGLCFYWSNKASISILRQVDASAVPP